MKINVITLFLVMIIFVFTSCSNNKKEQTPDSQQVTTITYSNLNGDKTLSEIKNMLKNKINDESLNLFLDDVVSYNDVIKTLSDDFTVSNTIPVDYDLVKITELLDANNIDFLGNNCRITTFELIKDLISLDVSKDIAENLVFDNNSLSYSKKFDEDDFYKFNTFYKNVETKNTTDINEHLKNMKNYFNKINLKFNLPENLSVISVVFHDNLDENNHKLFVGHTGLLIKHENEYYFIEKLSFELPYQVVKFKDKKELNNYLMKYYDTSWGQEIASPFIMENDELLKEYSQLPKDSKNN